MKLMKLMKTKAEPKQSIIDGPLGPCAKCGSILEDPQSIHSPIQKETSLPFILQHC